MQPTSATEILVLELITSFNKKSVPISLSSTFARDLAFDSLTVMDLVAAIEDEYDLILPLNMLPDLETVQQLINAVEALVKAKHHA